MAVNTTVTMLIPRKRDVVCIAGLMVINTLEIGATMPFMVMVFTYGLTVECIVVNGKTT